MRSEQQIIESINALRKEHASLLKIQDSGNGSPQIEDRLCEIGDILREEEDELVWWLQSRASSRQEPAGS